MTIEQELITILEADPENMLHPEVVVDWAEHHPDSALHRSFEWDDQKAAHSHRLWQARQIIKLHVIDNRGQPQMISLKIDRKAGGGYRELADVMAKRDLRAMALQEALDDLRGFERRYSYLEELAGVWREAAEARTRATRRAADAASRSEAESLAAAD
jgi:hypothetical protein